MKTRLLLCCLALVTLAACGNKTPEYQPSKELGNIPKQTLDRATSGTEDALKKAQPRQGRG